MQGTVITAVWTTSNRVWIYDTITGWSKEELHRHGNASMADYKSRRNLDTLDETGANDEWTGWPADLGLGAKLADMESSS